MKRFAETNKWDDPWFRSLAGAHKLIFLYVIDRCDNAGFWEVDEEALAFHTKLEKRHIEGAWKALERGLLGASGWVWVRTFLRHQKNENLNPENPAHRQVISLIQDQSERFGSLELFRAFIAPYKGLISPIGIGKGTGKKGSAEGKPESRDAAIAYGSTIGMTRADVDAWFDHFESNGWRVSGKAPMKDWQAALRNGNRRKGEFANSTKPTRLVV